MSTTDLTARFISALEGCSKGDTIVVLSFPVDAIPKPEYIHMPPRGKRCPYTDLSPSTLADYIERSQEKGQGPRIITRHIRQPGKTKGVRLIHYTSLMAWLNKQPEWTPATAGEGDADQDQDQE